MIFGYNQNKNANASSVENPNPDANITPQYTSSFHTQWHALLRAEADRKEVKKDSLKNIDFEEHYFL